MRPSQKGPGILISTRQERGDGRSVAQREKEATIVSGDGFSSSFPSDGWHLQESSAKGVREDGAPAISLVQRHIQKRGKEPPGNLRTRKIRPVCLQLWSQFSVPKNLEPVQVPVLVTF